MYDLNLEELSCFTNAIIEQQWNVSHYEALQIAVKFQFNCYFNDAIDVIDEHLNSIKHELKKQNEY